MKLNLYFGRKFLWWFIRILLGFLAINILSDSLEEMSKFSAQGMGYGAAIQLALLKSPASIYLLLPVIATLASLSLFLDLSRSSELVVARAAGRSALRCVLPPALMAFLLGVVGVAAISPILAATNKVYSSTTSRLETGSSSSFSLTREGLWLRQGNAAGQTVIFAQRANFDGTRLFGTTFFEFGPNGRLQSRITTNSARLKPGVWQLNNGKRWDLLEVGVVPEKTAIEFTSTTIPSDLTSEQILDSFGDPSAISIWDQRAFIAQLERSGFSALRYKVHFYQEIALPFLLAGMVFLAAGFTMRPARFGKTGLMVLYAVLTGFGVFFMRNFAQILGANGEIPVQLAAWGSPVVAICVGFGVLLHLEDG